MMSFRKAYGIRWQKGISAVCPLCDSSAQKCYDTIADESGIYRKRLRKCLDCGHTWTTVEMPVETAQDLLDYKRQYERLKERVKELNDGAQNDRQGRTAQGDSRGRTGRSEPVQVLSKADVSDSGLPYGGATR